MYHKLNGLKNHHLFSNDGVEFGHALNANRVSKKHYDKRTKAHEHGIAKKPLQPIMLATQTSFETLLNFCLHLRLLSASMFSPPLRKIYCAFTLFP